MIIDKDIFGYLSIGVTAVAMVPYLRSIQKNETKPHIFTWVIWTLVTGIAGIARGAGHAGPGAWGALASAVACLSVVLLALTKGEKNITRSDVVSFTLAMFAIPAWLLTDSPLLAVIIVTSADILGYFPTARKSFHRPYEERIYNYVLANVIHILSLMANSTNSLTTVLTPVALFSANSALIIMLWWRRKTLGQVS